MSSSESAAISAGTHAPLADTPLVFLDLETTGTRATRDRITEIAAFRVLDGRVVDRFVTLIDPGVTIPASITRLTGISDELLLGQPAFADIAADFQAWLEDAVLVAHNARFDISFLRNEYRRLGRHFHSRVICTLKLSRQLDPAHHHHGLDALMARHKLEFETRHRACGDASALLALWQRWSETHDVDTIETLALDQYRNRSLPAQLDPHLLDELPTHPGVYLFYGHNRLPLYVGKSVNLRSRVLSHFSSDHRSDREMALAQQLQHLEWFETAGDLGAQLLEASLIKRLSPIHNRRLRRRSALVTWWWPEVSFGPQLAGQEMLGQRRSGTPYGMFRSRREAIRVLREIAEQHELCPRLLGLENGRGRCFAHQLHRCRGACCGEETPEAHTRRARAALEQLRVKHWPWPGRVAFRETDSQGASVYHVVDHWCYLGSVETLTAAPAEDAAISFDVDTYRILNRFMNDVEAGIDVIALE